MNVSQWHFTGQKHKVAIDIAEGGHIVRAIPVQGVCENTGSGLGNISYKVFGPFDIPQTEEKNGVWKDKLKVDFWEKTVDAVGEPLSPACGCYVYAVRARKEGFPWYVGKSEKQTFQQE